MGRAHKILYLVIILEITATYTYYAPNRYCNIKTYHLLWPKTHTGCAYRRGILAFRCTDLQQEVVSSTLTRLDKVNIVRRHNEIRQRVAAGREFKGSPGPQPAATFMPNLTWDNELALLAQTWVNQCIESLDDCRDVDRFRVNQVASTHRFNVIKDLPDVLEFVNDSGIMKYDENTYHYTQMVWAGTTKIGCAQITLHKPEHYPVNFPHRQAPSEESRYTKILFCNYGPAGNLPNHEVYNGIKSIVRG